MLYDTEISNNKEVAMTRLKNDNFLRALKRQPVDRQPIWIMRQAGRYLPEYRETRSKAGSFLALCKTPELACEVTLQPLARFDLDAAIVFSDILTVPDAMGLELYFAENEGPRFMRSLKNEADIRQLSVPDPEVELRYVMDTIRLIRDELNGRIPLIGFAGSPWTVACYMLEGGSSKKQFDNIRRMAYENPNLLTHLLEILTQATINYLKAQIQNGVDAVMLFDTWGGLLNPVQYQGLSLKYMQKIIEACGTTPSIIFTKNAGNNLACIAQSGCSAVGVDWTMPLDLAKRMTEGKVAIQGNLDPLALFAPEATLHHDIEQILKTMKNYPGFIFNLGHGILPNTPPEKVAYLVDTVHGY